jgi:hypothetical protein
VVTGAGGEHTQRVALLGALLVRAPEVVVGGDANNRPQLTFEGACNHLIGCEDNLGQLLAARRFDNNVLTDLEIGASGIDIIRLARVAEANSGNGHGRRLDCSSLDGRQRALAAITATGDLAGAKRARGAEQSDSIAKALSSGGVLAVSVVVSSQSGHCATIA